MMPNSVQDTDVTLLKGGELRAQVRFKGWSNSFPDAPIAQALLDGAA